MGLDMYLHATRRFQPDDPVLDQVLATHGVTLPILQKASGVDDWKVHEQYCYLPTWRFMREKAPEKVAHSLEVLDVAGMTELVSEEGGSNEITWIPHLDCQQCDGLVQVQVTAAYWRKANAIHAWFVEHAQNGVDECQVSEDISGEQLALLHRTCEQALALYQEGRTSEAVELLPPQPGFFFGPTDDATWWLDGLGRTIRQIHQVVQAAALAPFPVQFQYHSSW